ncbi:MAG: SIS domain-containing protein [Clostridia bacterium]|nr:SIS domain-containing protein [Clostridia bacterium]
MDNIFERYPELKCCESDIKKALNLIIETYKNKGKILVCGNGGSAADSEHIVGELMKGFLSKREIKDDRLTEELKEKLQGALPAISLCSQTALITAFNNDLDPDYVFAQQVYGYGKEKDLLIAISTSGNSKNILKAVEVANCIGVKTLALTGGNGGRIKELATVTICVPSDETYKIQEYHLSVYHYLCAEVEKEFFDK